MILRSALLTLLPLCIGLGALGKELVLRTEANVMVEITLGTAQRPGPESARDPFNDLALDAVFIDPTGRELRVPGFWAGGDIWKVRYASPVVGKHKFRTEWSVTGAHPTQRQLEDAPGQPPKPSGLPSFDGIVEVKAYAGDNPLYRHGPVQIAPSRRFLEYADHTPFFWLGDTWWMGLCGRLRWPEEFQQLAADRKAKGFNVVQIVAGLYPDMPPFDQRGANEAGFLWETNYARIRPEYFDAADQRLRYLVDQGITPCIVGAWGYFMPWMGVEKMKDHWRYLIARYGALPVVWCAAGEGNLPWYLAKGFPYDDRKQVHDWTEAMRFIRETDPFRRPLTIHPTAINAFTARHATDDPGLLDFDMLQTPHGQREAVPMAVRAMRESYAATPMMPVLDGEASYEMLNDSLPTEWTRRMFWLCLMNGAAGHTYGANGIWQCNRPEQPHGRSPHGGSYGKIPWNEAMRLPGSTQVGLGKRFFEQFPWYHFRPHPEWAAFAVCAPVSLEDCNWIWFPEGNPARDAPVAKRFCRRTFVLPQSRNVQAASLRIAADDWFFAELNGKPVGKGESWTVARQFNDIARLLKPGTNVLAIVAENKPANVEENPAGLIACLQVTLGRQGGSEADAPPAASQGSSRREEAPFISRNTERKNQSLVASAATDDELSPDRDERGVEVLRLVSDETWLWSQQEQSGWEQASFDDSGWPKGRMAAHYGDGPWGKIGGESQGEFYGPQSAGIPGLVRVIYVPQNETVQVRRLEPSGTYAAWIFDPVSGATNLLGRIEADDRGLWRCPPPAGNDHDWVLVLQSPRSKVQSPKSEVHSPRPAVHSPPFSAEATGGMQSTVQSTGTALSPSPTLAPLARSPPSPCPGGAKDNSPRQGPPQRSGGGPPPWVSGGASFSLSPAEGERAGVRGEGGLSGRVQDTNQPAGETVSLSAHGAKLPTALSLSNAFLTWRFDLRSGRLDSTAIENHLSGHTFAISACREIALTFSATLDRIAQPVRRIEDFELLAVHQTPTGVGVVFDLQSHSLALQIKLHYHLDGPTRRKWIEVTNRTGQDLLLLDVDLDDVTTDGTTSGGGQGQPVFLEDELFAAIEHPAGFNEGSAERIHLAHYPGLRLAAGATFTSHPALVSVAPPGEALEEFTGYIQRKSVRAMKCSSPRTEALTDLGRSRQRNMEPPHVGCYAQGTIPAISIYTPFGINNQWGGCPTLDDEEILAVLRVLEKWQKRGVHFDYFTLDTGWVDPASDLTRFRPTCFPNGPGEIVRRVDALGMKFGLWFATSWAAESCWDNPQALQGQAPISLPWRLGYPDKAHATGSFCFGSKAYSDMLKRAVLYHVRENKVRLLKFDGGNYYCESAAHGHLPGKYSIEPMFASLIDIANSARAIAPDVTVLWYWGLRSPFWALYGDLIFESGLQMEGSGTSSCPTLYYRDSVTLAQDQNAQFAKNIPPAIKDSLGVWLADNRWGNFMGKERWREALVMDLGRGNLFAPNLWGDVYRLSDQDVDFLAQMMALAHRNQDLFQHRRNILGDSFRNDVYGYAYCQGSRGLLFLNNAHFTARHAQVSLDSSIGLDARAGTPLRVVSRFPEQARLLRPDGAEFRAGDTLDLWLRPFEVLRIEVGPRRLLTDVPATVRASSREQCAGLGLALGLTNTSLKPQLDLRFEDEASFVAQHFQRKVYPFQSILPALVGPQPILAVAVRLRKDGAEWRHAPTVVQIVQARARIGNQDVQMIPVPDGRQFGNTQSFGCSWVLYKLRLNPEWSGLPLKLAIHAWLPEGVEAQTDAWLVKRWWHEDAQPSPDGYHNDASS